MPTVAVEYVWCSGANTHHDFRSKLRSVPMSDEELKAARARPKELYKALEEWNFDGSSTGQAKAGQDTEIHIYPVASWLHPFMHDVPAFVCLCECRLPNGKPTPDNTRHIAELVFNHSKAEGQAPWFGLEQEYVLCKNGRPLGWPTDGSEPAGQGPYYCGTGLVAHGRKYAEKHYTTALKMGIQISGMNAEVMPGQWEYQIGPCEGIDSGDQACMARWLYLRILEEDGLDINFEAKPKSGDWNGSGMHCNVSTKAMREDGGLQVIEQALENMRSDFFRDIAAFGADNIQRMSGTHETSRLDEFNWGIGTRDRSCRVPNNVRSKGKGYFEDRRPSSSADPYLVTSCIFASSCMIPSDELDRLCDKRMPVWLADLKEKTLRKSQS